MAARGESISDRYSAKSTGRRGATRGLSVSTVGPSRDPDRRLRLRTHSLSTGWNTRINGGATMERERERTFVSIHVNYRTKGGERQREEGAPFFFFVPPAAPLFLTKRRRARVYMVCSRYYNSGYNRWKVIYVYCSIISPVFSHLYHAPITIGNRKAARAGRSVSRVCVCSHARLQSYIYRDGQFTFGPLHTRQKRKRGE